jgi:hypothetical protein
LINNPTLNNLFLACYTFGRLIIIVGVLFGLKASAFPPTTFAGELKRPLATKGATPGGAKRRFRFFKTDFKTALLGSVGVSIIMPPKVTRISEDAIKLVCTKTYKVAAVSQGSMTNSYKNGYTERLRLIRNQ